MKKLHAGSLYKDHLVLYGYETTPIIIQVSNSDLQWEIYCNDVEVHHKGSDSITIEFNGIQYSFPCEESSNPMKTLGFS